MSSGIQGPSLLRAALFFWPLLHAGQVVTVLSFPGKLAQIQGKRKTIGFTMHMTERTISGPGAGVLSATPRPQILVIEDDVRMQKILYRLFTEQVYAVTVCGDGQSGLDAFRGSRPAAVVLDLMLPNIFGRDLCRTIKTERPDTPVIIVSAISEVADKVLLLEMGADDYVTKPFSPRELMARVQAAIRRTQKTPTAPTVCSFGDCKLDFSRMSAERDGNPIALTAHEFKLLRYFIENPERVLSREELLNEVWGYNSYPTTRTVDNQILKLRQKLELDAAEPRHLRTVHGAGYKFVP
jgi:DNA-binding response OmpR family regulator